MSQLAFNTTNVDFQQDAITQVDNVIVGSAEDLIWDKTFKVRLTSNKTGKKIDLNITYNLRRQTIPKLALRQMFQLAITA